MKLTRLSVVFLAVWLGLTTAGAGDLTQAKWIEFMSKNLPRTFCAKDQYYRTCFDVLPEDCRDAISSATADCIDQNMAELPDFFSYKDIRHWGPIIEACIDKDFSQTFADFRIENEDCKKLE